MPKPIDKSLPPWFDRAIENQYKVIAKKVLEWAAAKTPTDKAKILTEIKDSGDYAIRLVNGIRATHPCDS